MTNRSAAPKTWRIWPRGLTGQLLLVVTVALFVAQSINAVLLYRVENERRIERVVNALGLRAVRGYEWLRRAQANRAERLPERFTNRAGRSLGNQRGLIIRETPPVMDGENLPETARRLAALLQAYDLAYEDVQVVRDYRPALGPDVARLRAGRPASTAMASIALPDGLYLTIRAPIPGRARIGAWLFIQTVMIFAILLAAIFFVTRRLSQPLRALTAAVDRFSRDQHFEPLEARGPYDVAALTEAYNSMASRTEAMLDEKDMMLGAIGHDLKTPLAALRVRIEQVEDSTMRDKMIESITRLDSTLNDILALARVGRSVSAAEPVNITAMAEMLVDEYADLGKPVTMAETPRIIAQVHVTWLQRALRNVIGNAVRYGKSAHITMEVQDGNIAIHIDDKGPGIAEAELDQIFKPFYRVEKSRNSATGGAGLGLAIARSILEHYGGTIQLCNRYADNGNVSGLRATLNLPR